MALISNILTEKLLDSKVVFFKLRLYLYIRRKLKIGWHYPIDLYWFFLKIKAKLPKKANVLVIGDGHGGVLQFLLADMGCNVVNVDPFLHQVPLYYRVIYRVAIISDLQKNKSSYSEHLTNNFFVSKKNIRHYFSLLYHLTTHFFGKLIIGRLFTFTGSVKWVSKDVCNLEEDFFKDFDAVFSLSAIEHIPKEKLPSLIDLFKILDNSNKLVFITTSGGNKEETFFHEPSKGLCFSSGFLKDQQIEVNWTIEDSNAALKTLKASSRLKSLLDKSYFSNANCGMPYGDWDPVYFPISISSNIVD